MLLRRRIREGTTLVECALIYPVYLLVVIGLIVGGFGVFRYQQLASLAREGARYASVRGATFQRYTGQTAATEADVYTNGIRPKVVALDPNRLGYTVTWSPNNKQGSQVTVKLTYHWIPEVFLGGIDLGSTSTMTVSY